MAAMISPVNKLHVVLVAKEQIGLMFKIEEKERITLKLHFYFSWSEICVGFMHRINVHQMHHISIFQWYVSLSLKVMWL